ncbi:hypothetical protein H2200_012477 [Cladophialophora chaetospira]|uniref:Uncharacterized protein n=1 Tax=Cladophialophora chaetospira TaxID=386627 RepID=A0AA38WY06_9EURO|nr:hypothetical protein H2200_012477 [Cladophialophora chaetospira]
MSTVTVTSDSTDSTLTLPTAGVGGSLYDKAFPVPVYSNAPYNMVTWRTLDTWGNANSNYAATQGIAAGLLWASLTYLLALTPNHKRTTPFHSLMLLGLIFLLVHLTIDMVTSTTPGIQPSSAYTTLTGDIADSVWTKSFITTFGASRVAGWFAFVFASICLWLQARGLMTGLKVRHSGTYKFILSYLAFTSGATLSAAVAYSIHQIVTITKPVDNVSIFTKNQYTLRIAYLICYTICIGSYSLVSTISIVGIVWRRPTAISGGSAYASALNLLGVLCAQSFAIPLVFSLLQVLPNQTVILRPEILLLPSVYTILPIGSLFMTANTNPVSNAESPRAPVLLPNGDNSPNRVDHTESDMTPANRSELPVTQPTSCTPASTYIDHELSRIDAMECGGSVVGRRQPFSWTETTLSDKDSQEKEVVTPETRSQ